MSLNQFRTIGEVVKEFQVRYTEAGFIQQLAFQISQHSSDFPVFSRRFAVDDARGGR